MRYYDPVLGRFTTRDPSGYPDGPNNYLYCGNNPINFVDPLGLKDNKKESESNSIVDVLLRVGSKDVSDLTVQDAKDVFTSNVTSPETDKKIVDKAVEKGTELAVDAMKNVATSKEAKELGKKALNEVAKGVIEAVQEHAVETVDDIVFPNAVLFAGGTLSGKCVSGPEVSAGFYFYPRDLELGVYGSTGGGVGYDISAAAEFGFTTGSPREFAGTSTQLSGSIILKV